MWEVKNMFNWFLGRRRCCDRDRFFDDDFCCGRERCDRDRFFDDDCRCDRERFDRDDCRCNDGIEDIREGVRDIEEGLFDIKEGLRDVRRYNHCRRSCIKRPCFLG